MSFYDDYLGEEVRTAKVSNAAALVDDPEQAARSIDLADATGVPATAIYGDVDNFERTHKATLGSQIIGDNESITDYINSHPLAAKLSHDDLGQLDAVSEAADRFGGKTYMQRLHEAITPDRSRRTFGQDLESFKEGFGQISPQVYQKFYTGFDRPSDVEWALSHPAIGALYGAAGQAIGLGEIGMEGMSRTLSGLLKLGHDNIQAIMGKSAADEFAAMAEYSMNRGDINFGKHIEEGHIDPTPALAHLTTAMQTVKTLDRYREIGKEPPVGVDPIIDKAKELQAKEDKQAFNDVISEVQKSATRERAPDFFLENFLRKKLTGEIGIDYEAVQRLYGDEVPTTDDGKLGFIPGLADQLETSKLTGDDIRVPMADWATKVDPELHRKLADDLRLRPDGVTINETKIEAEPKTVGADPLQQIRGAAGLEPLAMAGDRKLTLQRKERVPSEYEKSVLKETGQKSPFHDIDILDENGKSIGSIILSEQKEGKRIYIEDIQAGTEQNQFYQPNFLGPALVRDMKRQLKAMFPNAEIVTGHRATGARYAGRDEKYLPPTSISMPEVKLQLSDDPQPFRDMLSQFWQPISPTAQVFRKPERGWTPMEQAIRDAVEAERQKIVPQAEAETVHAINLPKAGGRVQALYNPATSKMFVSLEKDLGGISPGEGVSPQVSSLRHEAIHWLYRNNLILQREWDTLLKAIKDQNWREKFNIDQRYKNYSEEVRNEEAIAEAYRSWRLGEGIVKDTGVFQKIKDYMDSVLRTIKQIAGKDLTWEEIFKEIDEGQVGRREILPEEGGEALAMAKDDDKVSFIRRAANENVELTPRQLRRLKSDLTYSEFQQFQRELEAKIADRKARLEGGHEPSEEPLAMAKEGEPKTQRAPEPKPEMIRFYHGTAYEDVKGFTGKTFVTSSEQYARDYRGGPNNVFYTDLTKEQAIKEGLYDEVNDRPMSTGSIENAAARLQPLEQKVTGAAPEVKPLGFGLYDRGKALGVTDLHMRRMEKLVEQRNRQDFEASKRRAETLQRRRVQKEWKERRTTLRDDVRESLNQRPDIALDQLFSKQKIKFHPDYLSDDQRQRLPKDYIQKKDGVNPDDLAPYFGYPSGDALVERLGMLTEDRRRSGMSARDYLNRLIDVETDRRLNQEFGDREQRIQDEAKDQALSETQVRMVHEDTMRYAGKLGKEPEFTLDDMKQMAKDAFDKLPAGSISSDRLLQTAGKIGKKIEEAGAQNKWDKAYQLSQQRQFAVLHAKLARDYEKQRAQLDRVAKQFRKREVASIPGQYTNWIHDVLNRVGYPINRSIQDLQENIGRQSATSLADFVAEKEVEWNGNRELPIADFLLDPAFRKPVDELSFHDFMGLKQSVDALVKAGRDEKKIYVQGEAHDLAETKAKLRDQLAQYFPYKLSNVELSGLSEVVRRSIYGLTSKETTFNRWDKNDPMGLFNKMFSYPLAAAANSKRRMLRAAAKMLDAIDRPDAKLLNKKVDAPFDDPLTPGAGWEGFTYGHVLQMINNAGNESNWKVLARGYGADPKQLFQWLSKNTTKADWDRAQKLGDIFKRFVGLADDIYERMTGATVEKIPLKPFEVTFKDGTKASYPGWYHPLRDDPIRKSMYSEDADTGITVRRAGQRRAENPLTTTDNFHASTANGYTKKRTGAIYPLDLDFNMVPTTLRQMIHDIAYRETLHETEKIFNDPLFKEDVAKYYGREYADGLMPYLKKLKGAEGIPSKNLAWAEGVLEKFRSNIIGTYIGFNPTTMAKHGPTALWLSMKEVGYKQFSKARMGMIKPEEYLSAMHTLYGKGFEDILDDHDFIMKNSEELQGRSRVWKDTLGAQQNEFEDTSNFRNKMIDWGSKGIAASDMFSAKPTWLGAYDKLRGQGLDHGAAVDIANRAVRRAHGTTAETNLPPAILGAPGGLNKFLTSVYGFFGTMMQRRLEMAYKMNDAYQLGREGELKQAVQAMPAILHDMMVYVVWPTVVEEMLTSYTTEDKRGWGAHLLAAATGGISSSFLYARDLIHGLATGNDPGVGLLSSFGHDIENLFRDVSRGTGALNREHAGKFVEDTVTVLGDLTGRAPKQVGKTARFGIDIATGAQRPKNLNQVIRGVVSGEAERRRR